MQLNNIFAIYVAVFASTAAAVPHAAGPYHGARIAITIPPGNSTGPYNATTTGIIRPLTSGLSKPKYDTLG
ncbi:hypothetical protein N7495_002539 [Penicillium taxi]|uniref:uncharacterized protein n=1 Tax=Penicillium taxi TaxID=168475 RepID=UPI002544E1A1|nr:uncharacterized protein N7495_002539 [Penicillium taxi]KAJ5902011.1 hypothetical protein N7495_002539 [Penicillium taxi]